MGGHEAYPLDDSIILGCESEDDCCRHHQYTIMLNTRTETTHNVGELHAKAEKRRRRS